jgi:hypothetical protein
VFLEVPARKTVERMLTITEATEVARSVDALTPKVVQALIAETALSEETRAVLRGALAQVTLNARHREESQKLGSHKRQIEGDLKRTSGYLKAGDAARATSDPISARIVELERALTRVRDRIAAAEQKETTGRALLAERLERLRAGSDSQD